MTVYDKLSTPVTPASWRLGYYEMPRDTERVLIDAKAMAEITCLRDFLDGPILRETLEQSTQNRIRRWNPTTNDLEAFRAVWSPAYCEVYAVCRDNYDAHPDLLKRDILAVEEFTMPYVLHCVRAYYIREAEKGTNTTST